MDDSDIGVNLDDGEFWTEFIANKPVTTEETKNSDSNTPNDQVSLNSFEDPQPSTSTSSSSNRRRRKRKNSEEAEQEEDNNNEEDETTQKNSKMEPANSSILNNILKTLQPSEDDLLTYAMETIEVPDMIPNGSFIHVPTPNRPRTRRQCAKSRRNQTGQAGLVQNMQFNHYLDNENITRAIDLVATSSCACRTNQDLTASILSKVCANTNPRPVPQMSIEQGLQNIQRLQNNEDIIMVGSPDTPPSLNVPIQGPVNVKTELQQSEPNAELNPFVEIKFLWKLIHKMVFKVRKYAPLVNIVNHICKKENIESNRLYFVINDQEVDLSVNSSVTLKIDKKTVIEASALSEELTKNRLPVLETIPKNATKCKVQYNKKNIFVNLDPDDDLQVLFALVVIRFQLHIETFSIRFDGSLVTPSNCLKDFQVEEDECFDVSLKSQ